jgi:hypothetical protein
MAKKKQDSFRPIFRASDLGAVCLGLSEEDELKILMEYSPFSDNKFMLRNNDVEIENYHKALIKKEWRKQLLKRELIFDDKLIFDKISEQIENDFLAAQTDESLLKPSLSNEFEDYNKAVKSFIYMERGLQLEKFVRQQVNEQDNMRFSKDTLKRVSFDLFDICGIPDGIDRKAGKIIEIKTRANFHRSTNENSISPIEKIQCMCYMKLSGCDTCLFVEHGPNGEQRKQELVFDENDFDQLVVQRLRAFVLKYKSMSKSNFLELLAKYPNSFKFGI